MLTVPAGKKCLTGTALDCYCNVANISRVGHWIHPSVPICACVTQYFPVAVAEPPLLGNLVGKLR